LHFIHLNIISYNVASTLKTLGILFLGIPLFHEHLTFKQVIGISLAVSGIALYSTEKLSGPNLSRLFRPGQYEKKEEEKKNDGSPKISRRAVSQK
jgi:drug/metabolite transporter (DMT)-like permease